MGTGSGKKSVKSAKEGPPRRFGWQDQQEAESKPQFTGRLGKLGWTFMVPDKDLGIDYLVQIYDDGVSSGLSFYVQLKSIKGAEKRKGKRTPDELRYPLEVKDIEYWEVQSPPVVLVVWDLDKQAGYWETIQRIVEVLDKKGKDWREKKSVTVRVPVENGTDEEGMRRLRWLLADEELRLTRTNRDMSFGISFSGPDERNAAWNAFENVLNFGEPAVFTQSDLCEFNAPKAIQRLYGSALRPTSMMISPGPNKLSIPVRVEVRARSSIVAMPYVELRVTKHGRKLYALNNEHQNRPLVFSVSVYADAPGNFSFRRTRFGHTVEEARETVAFLFMMQQEGSRIRIISENDGKKLFDFPVPKQHFAGIEGLHDALERLAFIDPYISKYGKIELDNGIVPDDIAKITVLHDIIKDGRAIVRQPIRFSMDPTTEALSDGAAPDVTINNSECRMQVLGVDIPLGRVRETIRDSARVMSEMRAAVARAQATGKSVPIQLADVEMDVEFLDWPPSRRRLQDLAATQSGYFTLTQAFEAGFTSAEQLQIHERVERCADGVYRFVLHPGSDHEDLVVTWLQTEKRGVFSHDTALSLHVLSDILPVRQHITVPPGWKPLEGMALAANTVVHEGIVSDHEKSWMGPVPFTKPLRTLVDCIDDVLPPDILEQALSDAYGRGMLSPAELQSLQARKAKSA